MEAPPEYKAEVISLDKHGAIEKLNQSLEIIGPAIAFGEAFIKFCNK